MQMKHMYTTQETNECFSKVRRKLQTHLTPLLPLTPLPPLEHTENALPYGKHLYMVERG